MDKENKTSQEETNLLIHDKSTKVGTIYFIGLSSKFYAGKLILKKNVVTDKVVRQTILSENLSIIESGNFNMKQTAILIKGFTVFLHRQFEVLISDLQILYRKFFLNNENDIKNIIKRIRKGKNNNLMKNKILTLQDVGMNTNDIFLKNSNHLNRNKNIANVEKLMLKQSHNLYTNNYNFENLDIFNKQDEAKVYSNMFENMSSLNYSKLDNIFTLNDPSSNFFSKELSGDIKDLYNINEISSMSMKHFDRSLNTTNKFLNSLESNKRQKIKNDSSNFVHISFFDDKKKEHKNMEYNWADIGKINGVYKNENMNGNLNYSFSHYMSGRAHMKTDKQINNKITGKVYDKKKGILEIDQKITLKEDVWEELKPQKKEKRKFIELFEEQFTGDCNAFYLFNSNMKKKESDCSLFYKFYGIIRNYDNLDTRKELFNHMQSLIETENQNYADKAYHHGTKRKLYYNAMYTNSSLNTKNDFYFEQMRENLTKDHFMDINQDQRNKKRRLEQDYFFNDSSIDQKDKNIHSYFYNSISDTQYEKRDQMKLNKDENMISDDHNFGLDANSSIFKDNSKNSTLLYSLKDSTSIPSSKLMNKRSSTTPRPKYEPGLLKLKTYIEKFCISEKVPLEFETICPVTKINYKNASITFYNLLVLASNDDIELIQKVPGKKIIIQSY